MELFYGLLMGNKIERKILELDRYSKLVYATWNEILKEYAVDETIDIVKLVGNCERCIYDYLKDMKTLYQSSRFLDDNVEEIEIWLNEYFGLLPSLEVETVVHLVMESVIMEVLEPIVEECLATEITIGNYYNN